MVPQFDPILTSPDRVLDANEKMGASIMDY